MTVEDLLNCASTGSESCLFFSKMFFSFFLQPVEDNSQHDLASVVYEADCPVIPALSKVSLLWKGDDK